MVTGNLNIQEMMARLQELHGKGRELEVAKDYRQAEQLFRDCAKLAELQGSRLTADHLRWHWGSALFCQGSYRECVAVLTPLIHEHSPYDADEQDCLCSGISGGSLRGIVLFQFCVAAMMIPVGWSAIERCLELLRLLVEQMDPQDEAAGEFAMGYRLAQLTYLERSGRYHEGLQEAKKIVSRVRRDFKPQCLSFAALFAAHTGAQRLAEDFICRQERLSDTSFFNTQLARVIMARQTGNRVAAARLAEELECPRHVDRCLENGFRALVVAAECQLATGRLDGARGHLRSLFSLHKREQSWQRLELLRLSAEYHLALARQDSGVPPEDCRFGAGEEDFCAPVLMEKGMRQARLAALGFGRAGRFAAKLKKASGLDLGEQLAARCAAANRLSASPALSSLHEINGLSKGSAVIEQFL
jgi:tetratricopeptide (TPR) repeat protein